MGVQICRHLVIEAAFELAALPGQLLRIQGKILRTGGRCSDGLELRDIIGAAQLPAAYAQTTDEAGLLAGANLLHLHADVELFGKILDELTEVHAAIGNVIEDGLGAVALEFHVADFHFQAQVIGQYAGSDHGFLFPGYGFLPTLYVVWTRFAVDFPDFRRLRVHALALHLPAHDGTFQRHDSQIMPRGGLHHHQVPGFDALAGCIHIESLPGILETHLKVGIELLLRDALEVIVNLKLAAALTVTDIPFQGLLVRGYGTAPETVVLYGFVVPVHVKCGYIVGSPCR